MEDKNVKCMQQAVPVVVVPQSTAGDEIELIDLWKVLWRRRFVLFSTMAIVLMFAVAYAFLATPVYEAEAHLLPPMESDIQQLQIYLTAQNSQSVLSGSDTQSSQDSKSSSQDDQASQGTQSFTIKTKYAYALFLQNLNSLALRRQYFNVNHIESQLAPKGRASDVENVFRRFNKALVVKQNGKDTMRVLVSYRGTDASLAAKWVNGFVDMANKRTVGQLVQNAASWLASEKQMLRNAAAVTRRQAIQRKDDRLIELAQAAAIAERVGIKKPMVAGQQVDGHMPLYLLGYQALQAEAKALRQGKDNDAFAVGLRGLEGQLATLDSIQFDPSRISAVTIDQAALVPDHRIKPKRTLIGILGLVVGAGIGVLMAFFVDFVARAREQMVNGRNGDAPCVS